MMDPVQLTSCTLTLVQNVGSFLCINIDTLTPHMGLCRILHDTHLSWLVGWEPVRIISKSHNFLFGTTTIQSFTFSNSHFFSGQSQHASSPSIVLYLWLGAIRPTAQSYNSSSVSLYCLGWPLRLLWGNSAYENLQQDTQWLKRCLYEMPYYVASPVRETGESSCTYKNQNFFLVHE